MDDVRRICALAVASVVLATSELLAGGDPKGVRNLASRSDLPQGKGLAARYAGDHGIAADPAVIFADDFEKDRRWDSERNAKGEVLHYVSCSSEAPFLGRRTLRVTATLGKNTGGGLTKWFPSSSTVFIRFYVKFDRQCDYLHHFVTLRANKSLKGKGKWSGFGGAGIKPRGDERFSTALEPWGNWARWPPPGRWHFYSYWHTMAQSRDGKYWGNSFAPADQPNIVRGRWICAEFMLKHNTPGKPDGEQAFWIDGILRGHWKGINWRKSPTLWANALTLETYVTGRWTKNKVNIVFFDNVVIATQYIGPVR